MSNDALEGRLAWEEFARLPEVRAADASIRNFFRSAIGPRPNAIECLGFCLSERGDLLSQWRGYANDGLGVSIGFSKEYLTRLCLAQQATRALALAPVSYDEADHARLIKRLYSELLSLLSPRRTADQESETALDSQYHGKRYEFYRGSFLLKSAAFCEEREWRLFAYLGTASDADVQYRAAGRKVVPYLHLDLVNLGCPPILEVVLGPKHTTPEGLVQGFLTSAGFDDVKVTRSCASYR